MDDDRLKKALFRRALGYSVKEETVEFAKDDSGEEIIAKRKVSIKHIPPDLSALKILLNRFFPDEYKNIDEITEEDLAKERENIFEKLKEEEKDAIKKDIDDCSL